MLQRSLFDVRPTETRDQAIQRLLRLDEDLWRREMAGERVVRETSQMVADLRHLGVEFDSDPGNATRSDRWVDEITGEWWPAATRNVTKIGGDAGEGEG